MRERKPLGLTIEREQRGERLVSRWLSLEIRSLADLMTSVQYLDRKIKGQRPKGATDELRRPHALLLNELGNWRTRKTRQRNRLTLAKQGPVTPRHTGGSAVSAELVRRPDSSGPVIVLPAAALPPVASEVVAMSPPGGCARGGGQWAGTHGPPRSVPARRVEEDNGTQ